MSRLRSHNGLWLQVEPLNLEPLNRRENTNQNCYKKIRPVFEANGERPKRNDVIFPFIPSKLINNNLSGDLLPKRIQNIFRNTF